MLEADKHLLALFRRGERQALARVYRLYVDDVARTLRAGAWVQWQGVQQRVRTRLSEPELEDLIHETFARAFAPAARTAYDGVRPYGAYLGTIARNLLVDNARRSRKERLVVSVEPAYIDAIATEPADPLWPMEERELHALVMKIVASLPARQQTVFELRYQSKLRHVDIALRLGMSRITVRRIDVAVRHLILEELRRAGYLDGVVVGIPANARDRSSG